MSNITKLIRTPIAELEEIEEGLIHANMLGHRYTLGQCIEHMSIMRKEFNADVKPLLVMVSMESMRAGSSKKVRDYFAQPENARTNKANAFIISSSISKITINLFLKFSKPSYPTKIFSNKEDALAWLKSL
ncbi:MAG: hypothetical protein MK212_09870 [Saprospiraceae bacterium]|nr:hypothetical protein [Saprospiraceae bacterium]